MYSRHKCMNVKSDDMIIYETVYIVVHVVSIYDTLFIKKKKNNVI